MNSLSEIFKRLRERYPRFSKRCEEADALSRWSESVGPAIARHTRAIRVEKGVLWVEVDHAIWRSELHYRKRQILELLNRPKIIPPQKTPGQSHPQKPVQKSPEENQPSSETLTDILFLDPRPQPAGPKSYNCRTNVHRQDCPQTRTQGGERPKRI